VTTKKLPRIAKGPSKDRIRARTPERKRASLGDCWENLLNVPNKTTGLLNDVTRTEIARIQWLATGKSFVLAMVETDAILAKPPAQINFFVVDQRREVEQADLKIFDEATRFKDAIERRL
jgi:hypothetical protein